MEGSQGSRAYLAGPFNNTVVHGFNNLVKINMYSKQFRNCKKIKSVIYTKYLNDNTLGIISTCIYDMNKTFGVHHQNLSTADELIYFHVAYINFIATGILRISETNDQCVLIKDQSWVDCVDNLTYRKVGFICFVAFVGKQRCHCPCHRLWHS